MALLVKGRQVESVVRTLLRQKGYKLKNKKLRHWEHGADILAEKNGSQVAIECIGYQENNSTRSRQFYEVFFRVLSRIGKGFSECVIALPEEFRKGMDRRARQYGEAWQRIGKTFPELKIWFVDVAKKNYAPKPWGFWPQDRDTGKAKSSKNNTR